LSSRVHIEGIVKGKYFSSSYSTPKTSVVDLDPDPKQKAVYVSEKVIPDPDLDNSGSEMNLK
jgi:hypothetical protein